MVFEIQLATKFFHSGIGWKIQYNENMNLSSMEVKKTRNQFGVTFHFMTITETHLVMYCQNLPLGITPITGALLGLPVCSGENGLGGRF